MATIDDTASGHAAAPAGVAAPLERNITALMRRRARDMAEAPLAERLAAAVTGFLGSLWSVVAHAAVFGFWVLANVGLLPGVPHWDPTLVVLAMVASVEAIFLTTFVLINQNRQARVEEERNELALQIALLDEHETSRLVELVVGIAGHFDVPVPAEDEVEDLTGETRPDAVLDEIRRQRPDPL